MLPLQAYIDPGSGTLLLQSILAALTGVVLFHKRLYYAVKGFFSKNQEGGEAQPAQAAGKDDSSLESKSSHP